MINEYMLANNSRKSMYRSSREKESHFFSMKTMNFGSMSMTKERNFICIMIFGRTFHSFTILCQMNILLMLQLRKNQKYNMKTAAISHTIILVGTIISFDIKFDILTYNHFQYLISELSISLKLSDCLRNSFRDKVNSQKISCTLPWIMSMSDKINSSKLPTCQTKKEFGRVSTIGHEFSKQLAKYNNSRCSGEQK